MRIRVLPLPEERLGDAVSTPYGLVIDRCEDVPALTADALGARFIIVSDEDVEIS